MGMEASSAGQDAERGGEAQFNNAWWGLAVLLIAVGVLTGQRSLMALAACILVTVPVAWLWNRMALRSVTYERIFDRQRLFPGESIRLTVRVANRKLVPLTWLQVDDEVPRALSFTGTGTGEDGEVDSDGLLPTGSPHVGVLRNVMTLRWFERVSRTYALTATARGAYRVGPLCLTSGDAFTLFSSTETRPSWDEVIVYPRIWSMAEMGIPSTNPFGERSSARPLLRDPLRAAGVRDYRPQDDLRHVHWKATAHRGEMQVRVFEPVAGVSLVIVLNVATFQEYWRGILPALLERTIGVAGSIAAWGLDQQYHVGLIANGCPLLSDRPIKVPAGRTPGQLAALLEALARVTGFASTSIHTLLRRESPGLPLGAVLVVVTPIVSQELVATLATLRDAGRRLALVSLADDAPPALEGVVSYHIPPYSAGLRAAESNGEGMMTISRLSDLTASAR